MQYCHVPPKIAKIGADAAKKSARLAPPPINLITYSLNIATPRRAAKKNVTLGSVKLSTSDLLGLAQLVENVFVERRTRRPRLV